MNKVPSKVWQYEYSDVDGIVEEQILKENNIIIDKRVDIVKELVYFIYDNIYAYI